MTIDRMDTRVDVAPSSRTGSASASGIPTGAGLPGSPQPASPQGTLELTQALAPIIRLVVEEELATKLRIAGLR
jgi:hypothetical protein